MERLNHLEEIKESLSVSLQVLQEDDRGGIDLLMDIRNRMMRLKGFGQQYDEIWQRLNSVTIELEDIASDMESAYESLEADPLELEKIDQQLQTLYRLQKKHGVDTVGELIELRNSLDGQLTSYEQIDAQIEVLQNQLKITEAELESIAVDLHKNRKEAIPKLEQELHAILSELALPYATFEFQLQFDKKPQSNGMDHLKVLFSANKGVSKGPLDKVASGGEMSRVMLSIKAVMASYKELPTMVFDEIDTGVSGEVAYKMAVILNKMSKRGQVFSITHLPQTAARGDFHKKVFKEIVDGTTRTLIKELSPEERILEIAQMIGGNDVSDSAITHAKQLLN